MNPTLQNDVIHEALSWRHTPFHHKGRIKAVGVDCGGFLYCVYSKFLDLPPFPDSYAEDWALHEGTGEIYLNWVRAIPQAFEVAAPVRGGIALWKVGRYFSHGSLYLGHSKYIHAWGRTGFGSVIISPEHFFRVGPAKSREVKHFEVRL